MQKPSAVLVYALTRMEDMPPTCSPIHRGLTRTDATRSRYSSVPLRQRHTLWNVLELGRVMPRQPSVRHTGASNHRLYIYRLETQ